MSKLFKDADDLVGKLSDAGVPEVEAQEWLRNLLGRAFWGGWHQGLKVGETEDSMDSLDFDAWLEVQYRKEKAT